MSEELPPNLSNVLRDDIKEFRGEVRASIEGLVTREAFEAEKKHRDDQHDTLMRMIDLETEARREADMKVAEKAAEALKVESATRAVLAGDIADERRERKLSRNQVLGALIGVSTILIAAFSAYETWLSNAGH